MSDSTKPKNLNDQLAALDILVAWFDQPDIDVDEALKKFEEGIALTEAIKKQLAEAENKITILKQKFDQERA